MAKNNLGGKLIMSYKKFLILAISSLILSGCSMFHEPSNEEKCGLTSSCGKQAEAPKNIKYFANEEDEISLQNLTTRVIVHCHTTQSELAETCAQAFEKQGFTRFRDIPYKSANYDLVNPKDTFPVRRWRNGEKTPRW